MFTLQSLRQSRTIVRWMLVWFALAIGVAVAAPVVNPQALQLVCSAGGSVKLVVADDTDAGVPPVMAHTLDCVMCLPAGAVPLTVAASLPLLAMGQVQHSAAVHAVTWRTADPASARGPPSLL